MPLLAQVLFPFLIFILWQWYHWGKAFQSVLAVDSPCFKGGFTHSQAHKIKYRCSACQLFCTAVSGTKTRTHTVRVAELYPCMLHFHSTSLFLCLSFFLCPSLSSSVTQAWTKWGCRSLLNLNPINKVLYLEKSKAQINCSPQIFTVS